MANNRYPSQLRTRMARVSRVAYKVLLDRALVNQTTMADEVDALLNLEKDQLELTKPLACFEVTRPEIQVEVERSGKITVERRVFQDG